MAEAVTSRAQRRERQELERLKKAATEAATALKSLSSSKETEVWLLNADSALSSSPRFTGSLVYFSLAEAGIF